MGYYINLKSISLAEYQLKLASADLLKSRKILKESIEERFGVFKNKGINNLYDLLQFLKKKSNWSNLIEQPSITEEYLTILLRELNGINPKPNKFNDIPGIAGHVLSKLTDLGLTHTEKLYPHIIDDKNRKKLLLLTGFNKEIIDELTSFTDLSRIKWASPLFVRMLFDIGITSVAGVAASDPNELHRLLVNSNAKCNYFKGNIGLNDIKLFVKAAQEVSLEVQY